MTETARTIIDVGSAFSNWVSEHIVAIGAVVTATLPMLHILNVVELTTDQLSGLQLGIGGLVAAVTGKGMVTKQRMGERVEEAKVIEAAKVDEKVEAKVAEIMTGTGNGTLKP